MGGEVTLKTVEGAPITIRVNGQAPLGLRPDRQRGEDHHRRRQPVERRDSRHRQGADDEDVSVARSSRASGFGPEGEGGPFAADRYSSFVHRCGSTLICAGLSQQLFAKTGILPSDVMAPSASVEPARCANPLTWVDWLYCIPSAS